MFHPEVVDFDMPGAAWFQGMAIISIKKNISRTGKKSDDGVMGHGTACTNKDVCSRR